MTESDLTRQILELCRRHPAVVEVSRMNAGKLRVGRHWVQLAPKSWPDIIGYLRGGRFFGVEVKDPGQPKSAHADRRRLQEAWRVRANNAGALVFQAESVDEATERLNRIKEE